MSMVWLIATDIRFIVSNSIGYSSVIERFLIPRIRCLSFKTYASNTDKERLQRLLEALEKVRAMNGSPDIINSLVIAIEQLQAFKK